VADASASGVAEPASPSAGASAAEAG